jgi:hypothetical protein
VAALTPVEPLLLGRTCPELYSIWCPFGARSCSASPGYRERGERRRLAIPVLHAVADRGGARTRRRHRGAAPPRAQEALHTLAREAGLLRKRKRRLLLTARAKAILREPESLIATVAPHLYAGNPFQREVAELASAVLLVERGLTRDALASTVHDALREDWQTEGGPLEERGVEHGLAPFRNTMLALGALSDQPKRERLSLSDAGAELFACSLRCAASAL